MNIFADYYGLSCNPFDKESLKEQNHFESDDFKQMTSRLSYLKDVRGVGVFTARPGMGKTYALRCFASGLNPNLFHMEYICLSTVGVSDFYKQLCSVLGISPRGGKTAMFRGIQEQLYYLYKEKRQPLILAVDEAQELSPGILNDLKMLLNFRYDSLNCFTLILCGESHLNNKLSLPVHEAIRQRITVHYDFQGLSVQEIPEYVRHKIRIAGGAESIVSDAAMSSIHSLSQGNPRIIDTLMTDALTIGAQTQKAVIDADVIMSAANNRQLG